MSDSVVGSTSSNPTEWWSLIGSEVVAISATVGFRLLSVGCACSRF